MDEMTLDQKKAIARARARIRMSQETGVIDPTAGMSGLQTFGAGFAKPFVDMGRGAGQIAGDIAETAGLKRPEWAMTQSAIDEARALDRPLMNTGSGIGGNILGNIAAFAPMALVPGANTIGGGAALGGIAGALQPVASNENRISNVASGGVAGAFLPAAVRGYKIGKAALIDPFTMKGQQRIVGNVLNQSTRDPQAVIANLNRNTGKTPGFNPTAGQASMDDGMASLERAARAIDPAGFQNITNAQRSALVSAVKGVAGTPEARQAAVDARESATKALYEQAKKAIVADDGTISELLKRPSMNTAMGKAVNLAKERGEFTVPKAVQNVSKKPIDTNKDDILEAIRKLGGISQDSFDSMFGQSVRNDLKFKPGFNGPVLTKSTGKGHGVDEVARELYQKGYLQEDDVNQLLDHMVDTHMYDKPVYSIFKQEQTNDPLADAVNNLVSKLGENKTKQGVPQSMLAGGKISGSGLHDLKMGLDDAIGIPGQGGLVGAERNAALDTKAQYMNWLESKIPEYAKAKATYADMSKPINQMDIGEELYKRFVPALSDSTDNLFKIRPDSYAQALRNGDQLARNVTGMKGLGMQDIMNPQQMGLLGGVADDAALVSRAGMAGRGTGSDTVQKMAMSNLMNQAGIPNWIQSVGRVPGGWLKTIGQVLYTKNDEALKNVLAEVIKDPQAASQAMQMARTDPNKFMKVMQTAVQGMTFTLPSMVNAHQ